MMLSVHKASDQQRLIVPSAVIARKSALAMQTHHKLNPPHPALLFCPGICVQMAARSNSSTGVTLFSEITAGGFTQSSPGLIKRSTAHRINNYNTLGCYCCVI